jgi:long-subunit fatty acid transport protein
MTLLLTASVAAQDQSQAFRFSQYYPIGTARFQSMGGAFGAVGGDFSAASLNPAGLGLYRGSEFTITPSFNINNSTSHYLGSTSSDNVNNFSIGNLGLVSSYTTGRNNGLVGTTFAFGYNALNNFHSTTIMQGVNEQSSLLDNFAWYANNSSSLDIFYEDLAHSAGLMPLDTVSNTYWHFLEPYDAIGYEGYGQEQRRIVERRGYVGEYVASAALNIGHKLYLGGTFGLHAVRFYEDIYHSETDVQDEEPEFSSFRFGEYNTTRGYGYVFKVGFIFKPVHMIRIGASFHAPVVYKLTDDKFTDLYTYWDTNSGLEDGYVSSGMFSKEYTVRTPYRASLSTAVVLGKLGLVSAEYEYVDYSSADMDSPGYDFVDENIAISRDFGKAHNIKAGAELRLNNTYFRAGMQYYMNPFTDERNGSDIMVYSGGIGFRGNPVFVDLSYSLTTSSELYGLYQHSPEFEDGFERSFNDYNRSNIMLTLGYKF